ncbi:MAG TPA: glycosyltransferase family 39 protein, partial [Candidatus Binatia bacterium]|nr:glycosyltransferase family 39 protein [Candidatus Binatia bacterium]
QVVITPFGLPYAAAQSFIRADTTFLLFLFVILAGTSVRFYGLDWGLPYHFHTDERFVAVSAERLRTAEFIAQLTDQPYFFLYPPFISYLLIGLVNLVSFFHPFSPTEPAGGTLYYLMGRGITACFGSATLVVIYLLGKRLYTESTGLLAAAFLAFSVLHVRDSHFYFPDVPFTFFVLLVVLFAAKIAQEGRIQSYIFSGIFAGVGMATKQTAVMTLPVIVTAHAIAMFKHQEASRATYKKVIFSGRFWGLLLLPMFVAALTFLLLDPFVLINPRRFLQMSQILEQFVRGINQPHWTFQFTGTTISYWFTNLLYFGMGPLLEFVSLVGLLWAVVQRKTADVLVLAFLVPYFYFVGEGYMKFIRYAIPLLPFLCLLGARFLLNLWEISTAKITRLAVGGLAAAVIVSSGLYTLAYLNIYRQEDVRIQAAKWIHRQVPAASTILIDSSAATPLIGSRFFRPEFFSRTVVENDMHVTKNDYFNIKILNLLTNPPRPPLPPDWWQTYLAERLADVDYIIMSDEHYEQYSHRPETYPVVNKFYRDLLQGELGYQLIKSFKTYPSLLGHPLNDDRAELTFRLFDHPKIWIFKRDDVVNTGIS